MSLQTRTLPKATGATHSSPMHSQLAALCWRESDGVREVLLVTSSRNRWILPKGWPIGGKRDSTTAKIEAWEEAGVWKGKVNRKSLGSYVSTKRTSSGDEEPCILQVFAIRVHKTTTDFPESDFRTRAWVTPQVAATMVDEDGLRDILARFASRT
jgi:8-oxo-dGTP pyrophosphatase MutT (NUDIX family)